MKTASVTNKNRVVNQNKFLDMKNNLQDDDKWQSMNCVKQGSFSFAHQKKTDMLKSTQVSTFQSPKESMVLTSPIFISTTDGRFF